jgi:hypothetical protein
MLLILNVELYPSAQDESQFGLETEFVSFWHAGGHRETNRLPFS